MPNSIGDVLGGIGTGTESASAEVREGAPSDKFTRKLADAPGVVVVSRFAETIFRHCGLGGAGQTVRRTAACRLVRACGVFLMARKRRREHVRPQRKYKSPSSTSLVSTFFLWSRVCLLCSLSYGVSTIVVCTSSVRSVIP